MSLFGYKAYKLVCSKCGRKILVECHINGTNHNVGVHATCADCCVISEELQAAHPTEAESISSWIRENNP